MLPGICPAGSGLGRGRWWLNLDLSPPSPAWLLGQGSPPWGRRGAGRAGCSRGLQDGAHSALQSSDPRDSGLALPVEGTRPV